MHVEVVEELESACQAAHRGDAPSDAERSLIREQVETTSIETLVTDYDEELSSVKDDRGRSDNETKHEILECFADHCQHSMQWPLGFLEVDKDVYIVPQNKARVECALLKAFSRESLVKSGIFVAGNEGTIGLAPALKEGASFIVLRDAASNLFFELLTETGCLSPHVLPALEILHDSHTQRLMEEGYHDVIAAFDLEQVILLRACGLPATLAAGLEDVPVELVEPLCEAYGLTSLEDKLEGSRAQIKDDKRLSQPAREDPLHRNKHEDKNNGRGAVAEKTAADAEPSLADLRAEPMEGQLVLLAITPSALSKTMPRMILPVVDQFLQLQQFLDVDTQALGYWEINDKTQTKLRFIAKKGSTKLLREALVESLKSQVFVLGEFGRKKPRPVGPPADYATAVARFYNSFSDEGGLRLPGPRPMNKEWMHVRKHLEKQIIGPLRKMAGATKDPIKKAMLTSIAELSNVFHIQTVMLNVQLDRRIARHGVEDGGQPPDDRFKKVMATADRVIDIARLLAKQK